MPASMAVLGGIATTDMATNQAEPKVYPVIAELETLSAGIRRVWFHQSN